MPRSKKRTKRCLRGCLCFSRSFQRSWSVYGLERVEAMGLAFNPEFHEAMMQQDDPEAEENTVLQELQKGLYLPGPSFTAGHGRGKQKTPPRTRTRALRFP